MTTRIITNTVLIINHREGNSRRAKGKSLRPNNESARNGPSIWIEGVMD